MFYDNHHSSPRTQKKKILCLHGAGTSGPIFSVQSRKLRDSLRHKFDFIFIDAPIVRGPGPGVMPYFTDSGPFYGWFSDAVISPQLGVSAILEMGREVMEVSKAVTNALAKKGVATSDIAGVMGFSQGALLASLLLFQSRNGDLAWSNLQFGVLICAACVDGLVKLITGSSQKLDIPTLHVVGKDDPWSEGSRMLRRQGFKEDASVLMEFDGGHQMPVEQSDVERMGDVIVDMSHKRAVRSKRREEWVETKHEVRTRAYEVFI